MTSSSSLTVAKLKALCVLHDLPTSGKKADLVERLLEAGLDANTLGLEMEGSEEADVEEVTISLESIDSAPAPPPAEVPGAKDTVPLPAAASTQAPESEAVLEAEVLEAEIIVDDAEAVAHEAAVEASDVPPPAVPLPKSAPRSPATIRDMTASPQVAVGLVLVLLAAGAGWYWFGQQVEPVTVS